MARKKTSAKLSVKKTKQKARKSNGRMSVSTKLSAPKVRPAKVQNDRPGSKKIAAKVPSKKATVVTKAAAGPKPQAKPAPVAKTNRAPDEAKSRPFPPKTAAPAQAAALLARPAPTGAMRTMATGAKAGGQKVTAPVVAKALTQKPPVARQPVVPKKPVHQRHGFKINEWIVYPAHGVGRIVGIEEQEIAGHSLELFVITFEKDKMTLRVPTGKSQSVGMRKLAEEGTVKRAMETLKGRARIKRTMWSRRAQEYEAKINSGDLIAIAEVVRELYRSESQPEQSYSERQLYEAALDRMAREIAAVEKLDERGAIQRITEVLAKSARGRRLAAEEAEVKARAA
jgi:CarD family transcriptional regulator